MKKNKIVVLNPVGGLANRLRAIVSTYIWANKLIANLIVYWFKDNGMEAGFYDLFDKPKIHGLTILDGTMLDKIRYGNGGKRMLFVPQLYQRVHFDYRFRNDNQEKFIKTIRGGRIYVKSCGFIGKYSKELLHNTFMSIFHLRTHLQKAIEERTKDFKKYTIGFHIRRTDNAQSISNSPTYLFLNYARDEMTKHRDCALYLASDSKEEKKLFKSNYPNVITNFEETTRKTRKGIEDAIIDMYSLAKCNVIYGSFYSSFSEFASIIGNSKLIVVRNTK